MGYEEAAQAVQDAYLDHRYEDAAAAVPFPFIDETSLLGPRERIAERMQAYAEAGVTTLNVAVHHDDLQTRLETLRTAADALDLAGVGE